MPNGFAAEYAAAALAALPWRQQGVRASWQGGYVGSELARRGRSSLFHVAAGIPAIFTVCGIAPLLLPYSGS